MEYRRLGTTGMKVSEPCLGTMTFGREVDAEGSVGLFSRFFEAGGNFDDPAHMDRAVNHLKGHLRSLARPLNPGEE